MSSATHLKTRVRASLHYRLECQDQRVLLEDTDRGFALANPSAKRPALLRAVYEQTGFRPDTTQPGLFRYRAWLPVRRVFPGAGGPIAFRAERLAKRLGMEQLHVTFSGYWPERGATLATCSFKELEALTVLARVPGGEDRSLVVSSAGNTGRAFLEVASCVDAAVTVVVPERALPSLWTTVERGPRVRLVVLGGDADYYDAIALGDTIAGLDGYYPEGGARNVARRDGMGTALLAAAEHMGRIPQHYVQAVGSGTGGIGAWEMALRLASSGWGQGVCRLHLVQNKPFTIMTDAWKRRTREVTALDGRKARRRIAALHAPVLSNRKPPFAIAGGVYDALEDTQGAMYGVGRHRARAAGRLFRALEGCDLDPAAEVALAGLIGAVRAGAIGRGDAVALNLTGGGQERLAAERTVLPARPDVYFAPGADLGRDNVARTLRQADPRG